MTYSFIRLTLGLLTTVFLGCKNDQSETSIDNQRVLKVAVINFDKFFKESAYARLVRQTQRQLRQEFNQAKQERSDALKRETENLKKTLPALSKDAQKAKTAELENMKKKFEHELKVLEGAIDNKLVSLRREFIATIQEAIEEILNEKDFDLILDGSIVLFHEENLDITKDVVKVVDRLKKDVLEQQPKPTSPTIDDSEDIDDDPSDLSVFERGSEN